MLYMIWIEFIRSLEETISYKKVFIMDLIIMSIMLIVVIVFGMGTGIEFFIDGNVSDADLTILRFMGFIYWMFISTSLSIVASNIMADSKIGILEIRLRGMFKYRYILVGEFAATMLITTVISAIIMAVAVIILNVATTGLLIFIGVTTLTLAITLIGMYGISLSIGGFSLIHKRIGSLLTIVSALVFFIFNTSVMYQSNILEKIPMVKALDITRNAYMGKTVSLTEVGYVIISNILLLFIGNLIFKLCEKKAITLGTIPMR